MAYDIESDDEALLAGEEPYRAPLAHRVRTWAALGALGVAGLGIATGHPLAAVPVIVLYAVWIFVRHWLARRAQERAWRDFPGGKVERLR